MNVFNRKTADRKSLRTIYTGLIRSILDYRSIVYNSTSETNLYKLKSIKYQELRIITGAFKMTYTGSILAEMGEPSLNIRNEKKRHISPTVPTPIIHPWILTDSIVDVKLLLEKKGNKMF